MSSPVVMLGSSRALCRAASEWVKETQRKTPALVLVPSEEAAMRWPWPENGLLVASIDAFAQSLLSSEVISPPLALARILEASLPPELADQIHPEKLPGLHRNAIETMLAWRSRGITPEQLGQVGAPWPALHRFVEAMLPPDMADPLRLYQYATTRVLSTPPPFRAVFAVQAGQMPGAAIDFLRVLASQVSMTVGVEWRLGMSGPLRDWLRSLPGWIRLSSPTEETRITVVLSQREAMAASGLEAMAHLEPEGPWDILDDEPGFGLDLFSRLGGLSTNFEVSRRERWRRFWRVSQGMASRAETIRWLQEKGVVLPPAARQRLWRQGRTWARQLNDVEAASRHLQAAREFGTRARQERSLTGLAALTEPWLLEFDHLARKELAAWRRLDRPGLVAEEDLVFKLFDMLPRVAQREAQGQRLVTADLVAKAPGERTLLWYGGPSDAISGESLGVLLPVEFRRELGLARPRERLRRIVFERAAERSREVLYVVAHDEAARFLRQRPRFKDAVTSVRSALPVKSHAFPAPVEWYRSHRDHSLWDAWSGLGYSQKGPLRSSPSQIERYGTCPLAYFYRVILGVGEPDGDEDGVEPSRALQGRWAHGVLEGWVDQAGPAPLTQKRVQQEMAARLKEVMTDLPPSPQASPVMVQAVARSLAAELAEAVFVHRGLWHEGASERRLTFEFGRVQWSGRIDRVDRSQGRVRVIDYKTGQMKNPNLIGPDNLQLPLYRQGLAQELGIAPEEIEATLVGVSAKNQFRRWDLGTVEHLDQMIKDISERIEGGHFHPLPGGDDAPCRRCAYRRVCPEQVAKEARRKWAMDPTEVKSLWLKKDTHDD